MPKTHSQLVDMAKIANCILLSFAVLLIGATHKPQAEGAWVSGVMTGFKIVNEIVTLLDKLNVIPSNDPGKINEMLDVMNDICGKIDDLSFQV